MSNLSFEQIFLAIFHFFVILHKNVRNNKRENEEENENQNIFYFSQKLSFVIPFDKQSVTDVYLYFYCIIE